jgi:hypothetical protein
MSRTKTEQTARPDSSRFFKPIASVLQATFPIQMGKCLRLTEAKGSVPGARDSDRAQVLSFPFAESAKGKCPRHTRAMGSGTTCRQVPFTTTTRRALRTACRRFPRRPDRSGGTFSHPQGCRIDQRSLSSAAPSAQLRSRRQCTGSSPGARPWAKPASPGSRSSSFLPLRGLREGEVSPPVLSARRTGARRRICGDDGVRNHVSRSAVQADKAASLERTVLRISCRLERSACEARWKGRDKDERWSSDLHQIQVV